MEWRRGGVVLQNPKYPFHKKNSFLDSLPKGITQWGQNLIWFFSYDPVASPICVWCECDGNNYVYWWLVKMNKKQHKTWKNIGEPRFYFYAPIAGPIWVRADDVMAIIRRRNALLQPIQFHHTKMLILSPFNIYGIVCSLMKIDKSPEVIFLVCFFNSCA